jgi:branched-chain amino acid transport system substrate-binding protein
VTKSLKFVVLVLVLAIGAASVYFYLNRGSSGTGMPTPAAAAAPGAGGGVSPAPAGKPPTAPAAPGELKLGVILPLTGSAAEIATQHRLGLDFAVEWFNEHPGDGPKVKLVIEDDENTATKTVSAYRKLRSVDGVPAVLTVMSGPSMAVRPVVEQDGAVLFANCGHPEVTLGSSQVFRNFPSSALEVQRMAAFCKETLGIKSVGVLYIDDAYGQGASAQIVSQFGAVGIGVLDPVRYPKDDTDYRAYVRGVAERKPDAVYVFGYGRATALVANQLREAGYQGTMLGSYNFAQPPLTTVSLAAIEGSYYTMPVPSSTASSAAADEIRAAFQKRHGIDMPWNAMVEFDAVAILRRASAAARSATGSGADLAGALRAQGPFDAGVMGTYEWRQSTNEWLCPMVMVKVVNGKPVRQ